MKLINNPEIKKLLLVTVIPTAAVGFAVSFFSSEAALSVILTGAFFLTVFLVFLKMRYRRISDLTLSIDKILNGNDSINIGSFSEGELSVLENDVRKMLSRLRSQKEMLLSDKEFLADSIADISHQIKTPLTSINLIITLLSEEDITEDRRRELLMELSSLIKKTEYLVSVLLKISKIDAGAVQFDIRKTDLGELIMKSAEAVMIPMDIKNQRLVVEADNIFISCDTLWTAEALGNILKNCTEHTPEGGEIRVTGRDTPLFSEITVRDSGCGFSEDDLPHIFERFYKGKSDSKDSFGIGLNLTKMVVERQNGIISAKNSSDGGAEFTVKLYKQTV